MLRSLAKELNFLLVKRLKSLSKENQLLADLFEQMCVV